MSKNQFVVKRPSGLESQMKVYLASADLTYCSYCKTASDTDDWTTREWFRGADISDELLPAEDSYALLETLAEICARVVTHECPACGQEFDSDPGDNFWDIVEDQFICTNDDEWYDLPHGALICCGNCEGEAVYQDSCYCIDMVKTNLDGTPVLVDGLPLAECLCGEGHCDQVVCLVCHRRWQRTNPIGLANAKIHARNHLDEYEVVYEGAGGVAATSSDCIICGTYCCAVHKTHVANHPMCWEIRV